MKNNSMARWKRRDRRSVCNGVKLSVADVWRQLSAVRESSGMIIGHRRGVTVSGSGWWGRVCLAKIMAWRHGE